MSQQVASTAFAIPLALPNGSTLSNRLAKAAMSECLGDLRHRPTDRLPRLYRRWADSTAGLLVTGNVMVDRRAIGEVGNVVVEDDRDLPALRAWAEAARSGGAQVLAQLNHPGRQVLAGLGNSAVAPSALRVRGAAGIFRTPRELTESEIEELVGRFATSAGVMVRAGFDGVEVHAAHGYLISQFLSPATNLRTDGWGGSAQKRRRFLLEVVRAVRREIGPGATLAVKLNSADFQRGGFSEDESAEAVQALAAEKVDLVEISGGTYESVAFMGQPATPLKASTARREAYFLEFAARVRQDLPMPLMLTGGFRSAGGMSEAIGSGAVDMIGLGRPLALEPDLPRRLLDGTATHSTARHRTLGIARFDGMTDLIWHTTQLQRMGLGKDPAPDRHPLLTLAEYSGHLAPYSLHRLGSFLR